LIIFDCLFNDLGANQMKPNRPPSIFEEMTLCQALGKKKLAVLIDPDGIDPKNLYAITEQLKLPGIGYIFIGGSFIQKDRLEKCLLYLKENTDLPLILFPGHYFQVNSLADGILFLSLISGRNPEFLIGQQVIAAPYIKASGLESMATAYLLIDGGKPNTATYMSNTTPIPADKPGIAANTAMAGEMLGLKLCYLDAGSGAKNPVSGEMIKQVRSLISGPLIVGGGVRSAEQVSLHFNAGADIVVVGNVLEENPSLLREMASVCSSKIIVRQKV
jgi:putative glycerol-1-phosphate prenyltransferase